MATFKCFASFLLAGTMVSTLLAETHCPGNVASLRFRLVNRSQMVVAISVDHSGPYNFLLDTGTEVTMIDPSLADDLRLKTHGTAVVAGVGLHAAASFSQLDQLAAGTHTVANQKVLVFDLHKLQSANLKIVGILGEDFLEHFDMLIDNAYGLLCLDDSGTMRAAVKGIRVPLLAPAPTADGVPLPNSLVIAVRLSDGIRPVRLELDSGANAPFLYDVSQYMALGLVRGKPWHGSGVDATQRAYSALPLQDVKIGSLELPRVLFVTLIGTQKNSRAAEFDGLLSARLFRHVFICHTDHFVVLDPW